jgi:hypothetical protein
MTITDDVSREKGFKAQSAYFAFEVAGSNPTTIEWVRPTRVLSSIPAITGTTLRYSPCPNYWQNPADLASYVKILYVPHMP